MKTNQIYCHQCGEKLIPESIFCHNCGAQIDQTDTTIDNDSFTSNAEEETEQTIDYAVPIKNVKYELTLQTKMLTRFFAILVILSWFFLESFGDTSLHKYMQNPRWTLHFTFQDKLINGAIFFSRFMLYGAILLIPLTWLKINTNVLKIIQICYGFISVFLCCCLMTITRIWNNCAIIAPIFLILTFIPLLNVLQLIYLRGRVHNADIKSLAFLIPISFVSLVFGVAFQGLMIDPDDWGLVALMTIILISFYIYGINLWIKFLKVNSP